MNRRHSDPIPYRIATPEMVERAKQTLSEDELIAAIGQTIPPIYSGPAPVNPVNQRDEE
ncbi:hypothetical protein [Novilysobacter erysipheiresistens]|uniref:Uncharacterized protein n=1 Tax=Novilysobacter erysipheiresistens TaxID=1749332 RepID=A0ABU7YUV9_9GAMM